MRWTLPIWIFSWLQTAALVSEPVFVCHTPNSVLRREHECKELYAGCRARLATCSDVAWLPDGSGFLGLEKLDESIWMYAFDGELSIPLRYISKQDGLRIKHPEKLTFSPDGEFLVVASYACLQFFPFKNNQLFTKPLYSIREKGGNTIHDVAFSTDGAYLAYSVIDVPGSICFCRKEKGRYAPVSSVPNPMFPLRPKALIFSPDDRFVIIGFSYCVSKKIREETASMLAVYPFDPVEGTMGEIPVSHVFLSGGIEALALSSDQGMIYSADQVTDQILRHSFDPVTGALGIGEVALKNPESHLSFPRGLSFSPDGKFLAVSNYGNDTITIYETELE